MTMGGMHDTVTDPRSGRSINVESYYDCATLRNIALIRNEAGSLLRIPVEDLISRFRLVPGTTVTGLACACFRNYDELLFYESSKSILMR